MAATCPPATSSTRGTSDLLAVPFDAENVEVTGGSVSIVEGVLQAIDTTGAGQYAFDGPMWLGKLFGDMPKHR